MQIIKTILKVSGGAAEITDEYGQRISSPEIKIGILATLEIDIRSDIQDTDGKLLPYPKAELESAGAFYLALDADYDQESIPKMLITSGVEMVYDSDRVLLRAQLPNTARISQLREAVAKEKQINLICEFGGYPAEEGADCAIFAWTFNAIICNRVYLGENIPPPEPDPGNKDYLTALETYAAISQLLIHEYSVDGENWHSQLNPHVDVFQRVKHGPNGIPSTPQLIPYGAVGLQGPEGYLSQVEDFDPEKEDGYTANKVVSFRTAADQPVCSYQALEPAAQGESPATNPEKWRLIAEGQKGNAFRIVSGDGEPTAATAGDLYIERTTSNYYLRNANNAWQYAGSLKGVDGQGITPQGNYRENWPYVKNDAVEHNYSLWRCKEPCTGIAPPELPEITNDHWDLLVAQGNAGTITIAEVRSLDPNSSPTVTELSGSTPQNRIYSIGVPRGSVGASGSMRILAEVNTLPYGSAPTVSEMSGSTANNRIYKLSIPEGKQGEQGPKGDGLYMEHADKLANRPLYATTPKGTRFLATDKIYEDDGTTWYQLWYQKLSDEHDVWSDGARLLAGPKGDPFVFEDFTPEQLASLKGSKGDRGENAEIVPDWLFTQEHVYGGHIMLDGTRPIAQVEIFDATGKGRVPPISLTPGADAAVAVMVDDANDVTVIQIGSGLDVTYGGRIRFAQGLAALSPYQIWLNEGHDGTEAEYLAWLRGEANEYSFTSAAVIDRELTIPDTHPVVAVIDESGRQYPFALDEVVYKSATTEISLAAIMTYRNLTVIPGTWKIVFARGKDGEDFAPDERGTLAERAQYDNAAKGFSYLDIDAGVIYHKLSNASGDWNDGFSLRGDTGTVNAVISSTEPENPVDGMIWIEE